MQPSMPTALSKHNLQKKKNVCVVWLNCTLYCSWFIVKSQFKFLLSVYLELNFGSASTFLFLQCQSPCFCVIEESMIASGHMIQKTKQNNKGSDGPQDGNIAPGQGHCLSSFMVHWSPHFLSKTCIKRGLFNKRCQESFMLVSQWHTWNQQAIHFLSDPAFV